MLPKLVLGSNLYRRGKQAAVFFKYVSKSKMRKTRSGSTEDESEIKCSFRYSQESKWIFGLQFQLGGWH